MASQLEKLIKKAMWVLLVAFAIRCFISYDSLKSEITINTLYTIWGYAGEAVLVTSVLVFVYQHWLWKFDPTVQIPVLKKHYTGTIKSAWNGQDYVGEMEIKQTYLNINVILKTNESKSKSVIASIDVMQGEQQLTYTYLNTPMATVRDRSEIHYGTAMLCVDKPDEITGIYFTDRKSTGDMKFTSVD